MAKYPVAFLKSDNFAAIPSQEIEFSPQLNVIVGENGSGKTQLIKLLYAATRTLQIVPPGQAPNKEYFNRVLTDKLTGVFRPDKLGRLVARNRGRTKAQVQLGFANAPGGSLRFNFATNATSNINLEDFPILTDENGQPSDNPVFLPTHELLSFPAALISFVENYQLDFDETWIDTMKLLLIPSLRGRREHEARELLKPLREILGDALVTERNGRFYLERQNEGNFEAPLVAEGELKLAMLHRLVSSGILLNSGYLFWDEPESNLNPKSQVTLTRLIKSLVTTSTGSNTQVFLATHSLFLLREFQIVLANSGIEVRYIGMNKTPEGREVEVVSDLDKLEVISALEAEADQTLRYYQDA